MHLCVMANILCIETSGSVCSVALFQNSDTCIGHVKDDNSFQHAAVLTVLIDQLLVAHGLVPKDISAVALSAGPGSYTGLRIGTSVAKGFCYALNIPLIRISSLKLLAQSVALTNQISKGDMICPVIDARRMEVYTATYDSDLTQIDGEQPSIIDETSFSTILKKGMVFLVGSGGKKIVDIISHQNLRYIDDVDLSAQYMGKMAFNDWDQNTFVDLAYFEPNYLKAFHTTAKAS
ncbi:MAG: tRNA threonylcarbamoyladenosine biosynthesis protein TsaB [Bacteroidia bacterium]|jgi:tRNA threonylcarbamoyladenosine biosynthesis protein TsaB